MRLQMLLFAAVLSVPALPVLSQEEPKKEWKDLSDDERYSELSDDVDMLIRASGPEGLGMLEKYLADFPFKGVGIGFDLRIKRVDQDRRAVMEIQVTEVWKESPAAKAGIRPGDWLIAVNGEKTCAQLEADFVADRVIEMFTGKGNACISSVYERIRSAETVSVELERDGNVSSLTLEKENLGDSLASFIRENLLRFKDELAQQAGPLAKLARRIEKSQGKPKKLEECHTELEKLRAAVLEPFKEVGSFRQSLGDRLQEN